MVRCQNALRRDLMATNPPPSAPPGWYQTPDGQWHATQPLPTQQPPGYLSQQPIANGAEITTKPSSNLVGAVLATLCCFLPLGVVACIYAAQVDSKWNAGDRLGAVRASKMARLFANLSLGVAVLFVGGILAISALGASAEKKFETIETYTGGSAYERCMADPYTTYTECQAYR
jgi:hypothetical protein